MTIEEIEKLADDEINKKLRLPKSMEGETKENIMLAHEQLVFIVDKILRNPNRKNYLSGSIFAKSIMRKRGIKNIKKPDNCVEFYKISSDFGEGVFFDAHKLFENGEYPRWIRPYYCFNNTHLYILTTGVDATILSGIAFIGKPFLHSVLLVDDNVIDFNYDLVISKDLYFKLTHFEVLAELTHEQLLENKSLIFGIKDVQSHVFNFAFEEVIEQEKKRRKIFYDAEV